MGDILDGSSLIVAILVAFYTMWQSEIAAAKAVEINPDPDNRTEAKRMVRAALWRVAPLLLVTLLSFLILGERAWKILGDATRCWRGLVPPTSCGFDDVRALFLLTATLLLALSLVLGREVWALFGKLRAVNSR